MTVSCNVTNLDLSTKPISEIILPTIKSLCVQDYVYEDDNMFNFQVGIWI